MADFTENNLSGTDMKKAYQFVRTYEGKVKSQYGTFNFDSQEINGFCQEHDIKKKENRNTRVTDNYFWFETRNAKGVNYSAHHFLRHIRNAMAHGNFKKARGKKTFYTLEDYTEKGKQTMGGKINADIFWKYLNTVLHSSQEIDNEINFK